MAGAEGFEPSIS